MRRATWLAQSIDCATVGLVVLYPAPLPPLCENGAGYETIGLAHSIKCTPQDLRNLETVAQPGICAFYKMRTQDLRIL